MRTRGRQPTYHSQIQPRHHHHDIYDYAIYNDEASVPASHRMQEKQTEAYARLLYSHLPVPVKVSLRQCNTEAHKIGFRIIYYID
ncbi:unnamed protein product [Parnassius apollo]|uniref:(apollo) hypothetical protein n=1 Tax=Parnassius apollo TaxID=110799 RepID=A0A8S3W8L5_PARAO|nr:unnamed protein product [Parnassius apollo]